MKRIAMCLAAAVHCNAPLFRQEQSVVLKKLERQATDRGRSLREFLDILNATVPEFSALVSGSGSRQ